MTGQPIVETVGLRRTFKGKGKNDAVEAVAGVDLTIAAGDIFGFLGPNGAGKTTTVRILATLIPPTAGTARVAGFDVAHQSRQVRERIGYVAQAGGSYREATGREELVIQGRLFGMSKAEAGRRFLVTAPPSRFGPPCNCGQSAEPGGEAGSADASGVNPS